MRKPAILRSLFACALTAALVSSAQGQVLYQQSFDADDTANWNVNRRTMSDEFDSPVDFFFDYSTVGIPSAPNSAGGTTRGLKLQANMLGAGTLADPDALIGVSVSPTGQAFTGDYVLTADVWSNFLGPLAAGAAGSTMLQGFGILTAGTTNNTPGQSAAAGGIDGIWFGATPDGQSSADYRAYSVERNVSYQLPPLDPPNPADAHATYHAGTRQNTVALYVSTFPSVSAPAAQAAAYPATQTGSTSAGAFGMAWHEIEVKKVGNIVTWSVNGTLLITVDATEFIETTGGDNISLNYTDTGFTTNTVDPTFFDLQFGLFDNVKVTSLTAAEDNADFDNDGDVDGADFLTWQRGVGIDDGSAQLANGDANDDGNVNAADLDIWETQFGGAAAPAVSAIPEPSAWLLSALAALACVSLGRSRRRLAIVPVK